MLCITDDFNAVRFFGGAEGFQTFVNTLERLKADRIALDAASPDLTNYPSAIGTHNPHQLAADYFKEDPDPLATVVPGLKESGHEVLANVRMNDHHGKPTQWAEWEQAHVEWSLGVDTGARDWKSIGKLRCMDYAIEEVREHRLAILEEVLESYPFDGLQLDFSRTPPFVSQPKGANGKHITDYLRMVRQLLKTACKGEGLLTVILPWDLDLCRIEGLEVERWVEEGLVDSISPGEKYYADWNLDFGPWLSLVEGTAIDLIPITPGNVSPYQDFENGEISLLGENTVMDLPKLRAIASNFLSQGVSHFGLYNFYTFDFGSIYAEVREAVDPEANRGKPKHFFFCRCPEYVYREYLAFDKGVTFRRHELMDPGETAEWRFRFTPDPESGVVDFRMAVKHLMPKDRLRVELNGEELDGLERNYEVVSRFGRREIHTGFLGMGLPIERLAHGMNTLRVEVLERSEFREPLEVGEVELWSGR